MRYWKALGPRKKTRASTLATPFRYCRTFSTSDSWNPPVLIEELFGETEDEDGSFARSGLQLYFSRGPEPRDLFVASRPELDSPFGTPVALGELNSPSRDFDPWVTDVGDYIVFASDLSGNAELYEASR